jgi:sugar lactone lactonase YvrE
MLPRLVSTAPVTLAFDVGAGLGEGALWDWRHDRLVSVDILVGRVLISDPADGTTRSIDVGQPVSAALLRGDDELLLAVRDGFATLELESGRFEPLVAVEADNRANRMNDAAVDARGRCLAGTMAFDCTPGQGTLYRLDPDLSVHPLLTDLTISNGIGWSPGGGLMYHVDTGPGVIDVHDYDEETGAISNRRRLVDTQAGWGDPDGLTMDAEGGLWVAFWDGGAVRRFGADGEVTETIELPATNVTKPAFGGPDLDQLYVTTAQLEPAQTAGDDRGGAIFVFEPGVRGVRANVFAG